MTDEQLTEAIQRFLAGESLEAIAQSQGRPFTPHEPLPNGIDVSDEDLRDGIRRLLEETTDDTEEPNKTFDPSNRDAYEGVVPLEGIGDEGW